MHQMTNDKTIIENRGYMSIKHMLDFVFALIILVLFIIPAIIIVIAIKLESPGPAIYLQERVGACGKIFTMWKFRTMRTDTPVLSTEDMQKQGISYFTRLGPFLRKTNLDELPQLVNILKQDMSFVGPRPALPSQSDVLNMRNKTCAASVRPGLTGLAQVMGRDDLDNVTKVGYDTKYCEHMGIISDVSIIARTFAAVISSRGNK